MCNPIREKERERIDVRNKFIISNKRKEDLAMQELNPSFSYGYFYRVSTTGKIESRARVVLKRDKGIYASRIRIRIGRRRRRRRRASSSLVDRRGWKNGAIKDSDVIRLRVWHRSLRAIFTE